MTTYLFLLIILSIVSHIWSYPNCMYSSSNNNSIIINKFLHIGCHKCPDNQNVSTIFNFASIDLIDPQKYTLIIDNDWNMTGICLREMVNPIGFNRTKMCLDVLCLTECHISYDLEFLCS